MLSIFFVSVAFLFGLLLGNIATTLFHRLPNGITVLGFDSNNNKPPMCSLCDTPLKCYEFLPLLSWFSTCGTCNYCHQKIDPTYSCLEICSALISILLYSFMGFSEKYLLVLLFLILLLLQVVLYSRYRRLWIANTVALVVVGFIFQVLMNKSIFEPVLTFFYAVALAVFLFKHYSTEWLPVLCIVAGSFLDFYSFLFYGGIMAIGLSLAFYVWRIIDYRLYYWAVLIFINFVFCSVVMSVPAFSHDLPSGFVYLSDIDKSILQDVKYATADNFTGKVVPGYEKGVIILTKQAADALSEAQKVLQQSGYGLKVFDAYRPVTAVKSFKEWALAPETFETKARHYPDFNKIDLFDRGYISEKSKHSRGSTVDLTVVNLASGEELDMGTIYDFFGRDAGIEHEEELSEQARKNREILRSAMTDVGFQVYKMEWWHFELQNEPFKRYPEDHFDFVVR